MQLNLRELAISMPLNFYVGMARVYFGLPKERHREVLKFTPKDCETRSTRM